jgi:tetratricopeptide (TPR) repeat protein
MCGTQQICPLTKSVKRRDDVGMRSPPALLVVMTLWSCIAGAGDEGMSTTVIGPNPLLSEGTEAMLAARWQQGIELIERGLQTSSDAGQRAAAYSNLCAGYIALGDYDRALMNCDEALKLDANNWRTYNNRAGALLGKGRLDEALHDVEAGLALDPVAATLRKTETIVRSRLKSLYEPHREPASGSVSPG